ncbi:PGF-pre-PGF domain-containing protein [Candidatus Woesearchaeota archaeon]|nr:PGF-pre-PGF domain-containing protein [Candidatus Woesearchaeota archaeon]
MTCKNNIASVLVYAILVFSIVLVSTIAYAQTDAPALPSYFYGKAVYNGKNVPVNSVITAKIDSEKRGSIKVDVAGFYGDENSDKKLGVTGSRSSLGKTIEFYAKIPKLQEIKATQTYRWQTGTETKLDLTFIGEEIVDNSTEILEGQANITKQSFNYSKITAGRQVLIFIDNPLIPIIRLQLLTTANLSDVTIEFEVVNEPIAPKLDGVYKYISINAPKIQDSAVKTAILRFRVSNEWLEINGYDPATVKLFRYHNSNWDELETFHEGADAADNYYRAGTPGFSYFAIKAGKYVPKVNSTAGILSSVQEEGANKEIQETEKKGNETFSPVLAASQITGFAVEKVKSNPIIGVMLVLAGVLLGILVTQYFAGKNKAEQNARSAQETQTIQKIKAIEELESLKEIQIQEAETTDDTQDQEDNTIQEIKSLEELESLTNAQSTGDESDQQSQPIYSINAIEDVQTEEETHPVQEIQSIEELQAIDDIQDKDNQPIQEIQSIEELQTIDDIQTEQKPQATENIQATEDAQNEEDKQETKIKLEVK